MVLAAATALVIGFVISDSLGSGLVVDSKSVATIVAAGIAFFGGTITSYSLGERSRRRQRAEFEKDRREEKARQMQRDEIENDRRDDRRLEEEARQRQRDEIEKDRRDEREETVRNLAAALSAEMNNLCTVLYAMTRAVRPLALGKELGFGVYDELTSSISMEVYHAHIAKVGTLGPELARITIQIAGDAKYYRGHVDHADDGRGSAGKFSKILKVCMGMLGRRKRNSRNEPRA